MSLCSACELRLPLELLVHFVPIRVDGAIDSKRSS